MIGRSAIVWRWRRYVDQESAKTEAQLVDREGVGRCGNQPDARRDLGRENASEDDDQQPEGQRLHLRLQGGHQRRDNLEQVPDDPVVGHLEDRRIWILVDRDDGLRPFHADEMLDRT